jgi:WD40 repeat protein
MGGIGKTVLASALARDPQVQAQFPDGVYWVTVGIEPMLTRQQGRLAEAVSGEKPSITDVQQGKDCLRQCFAGKQALLILDDLWNAADAKAFAALDEGSRLLLTTRDREILTVLGAEEHTLGLLDEPQALELLAEWSGRTLDDLGEDGRQVAKECGYLPLALSITGAMLKGQPDKRWSSVLKRLQNADLDKIKRQFPDYPYPDLLKALQVSVDALEPDLQERYLDLAVFPEDTPIPETVIETYWEPEGLDDLDTDEILAALADKSLLQRGEDGVLLHDLQYDYITKQVADVPALHQRLLDAYSDKCDDGWPSGSNDGYYFQQLAYHLAGAERDTELRELLLNFNWLQAKLNATEVNSLINDYDSLPNDPDLNLVQATLRLSAHVLGKEPVQLRERLWGHLRAQAQLGIQGLLQQAAQQSGPWLCPQQSNLTTPGGPLLSTLEGHGALVHTVKISPLSKGKNLVVSASDDHTLKLWDLELGVELFTLAGHSGMIGSVAISPTRSIAVSASDDHTLKVWDLERGIEHRTLEGHTAIVTSVAISQEGNLAVSASDDCTLKVWDLDQGRALHTLEGHSGSVRSVAIFPDGKRALSASSDCSLKEWDLEKGIELNSLEDHKHIIRSVAISSDGSFAVSASYNELQVWDLEQKVKTRSLEGHSALVGAFLITENGENVISASYDKTLKIWDLRSGIELKTLKGHNAPILSLALFMDDRKAVSASIDRTLKIWDLDRGEVISTLEGHGALIRSIAITPDGKRVVSASDDETLKVWDLKRRFESQSVDKHSDSVGNIAITSDSKLAVSASDDCTLKAWDLNRKNILRNLEGHSAQVLSVVTVPKTHWAVSASYDRTLKVWDLAKGTEIRTLEGHTDSVLSVAITSDGKKVVSASYSGTLKIWDLDSGTELNTLKSHNGSAVGSLAITPDNQRVVSASYDNTLKIWDIEDGAELRTLVGHTASVWSVAMCPGGQQVVSASDDHTLKIWDLDQVINLKTLEGHHSSVWSVAVSSDGKRGISASSDRTLKVWDLLTGNCIATFWGDKPFYSCAIAPDGVTIVAGDQAGVVHFFRLEGV